MLLIFKTISTFFLGVLRIFITVLYDIFPDFFSEYLIFGLGELFLTSKVWRQLLKVTLHNDNFWRNTCSIEMLEQCCNHSKRRRNNIETLCYVKNRRRESSRDQCS